MSPSQLATEVLPYAAILNDSVKSNNPCTETVFFMTWGRKYGDQQNCASWPPVCTFLGMQQRLMAGYMTMAEQNNASVAPVGLSWKQAMSNDPDSLINLYSGDNSHPSLSGTYLTACVMYATLFQKSPVGSGFFAGLTENDALFLQQIAEDVVLGEDYSFSFYDTYSNINYDLGWESWFDFGNLAFAGFSFSGNDLTYSFIDNSLNADTYFWDFGDGATSSLQNPSYTYSGSGNYVVSQLISNLCFNDYVYDTINIIVSSTVDVPDQNIVSLYPNPGNGIFELIIQCQEVNNEICYKVYDLQGKLVDETCFSGNKALLNKQIDLSSLNNGIYCFRIYFNEKVINKTLIIQ